MSLDLVFFWLDLGLAGVGLMAVLLLAAEAGFRLGARAKNADDHVRSQFATIEGAGLAVVGLLLAFTFNMAATRFETRKSIVVNQANAIGTAYLRARLLPQPDRQQVEAQLQRYVDVLLELRQTRGERARVQAAVEELDRLQEQIWSRASAVARDNPSSVMLSLLLQSLNEVFDRKGELLASVRNRVPGVILLLLVLGAALCMGQVGYGTGLAGRRSLVAILLLSLLVAATIIVILDLDRPGRGIIQLDTRVLSELRVSMTAPGP